MPPAWRHAPPGTRAAAPTGRVAAGLGRAAGVSRQARRCGGSCSSAGCQRQRCPRTAMHRGDAAVAAQPPGARQAHLRHVLAVALGLQPCQHGAALDRVQQFVEALRDHVCACRVGSDWSAWRRRPAGCRRQCEQRPSKRVPWIALQAIPYRRPCPAGRAPAGSARQELALAAGAPLAGWHRRPSLWSACWPCPWPQEPAAAAPAARALCTTRAPLPLSERATKQ